MDSSLPDFVSVRRLSQMYDFVNGCMHFHPVLHAKISTYFTVKITINRPCGAVDEPRRPAESATHVHMSKHPHVYIWESEKRVGDDRPTCHHRSPQFSIPSSCCLSILALLSIARIDQRLTLGREQTDICWNSPMLSIYGRHSLASLMAAAVLTSLNGRQRATTTTTLSGSQAHPGREHTTRTTS